MANKLGYTWYPNDWQASDKVFEMPLELRGLYRELIDLAYRNSNQIELNYSLFARRYNCSRKKIKLLIDRLEAAKVVQIDTGILSIPSVVPRLKKIEQLRANGSRGGRKPSYDNGNQNLNQDSNQNLNQDNNQNQSKDSSQSEIKSENENQSENTNGDTDTSKKGVNSSTDSTVKDSKNQDSGKRKKVPPKKEKKDWPTELIEYYNLNCGTLLKVSGTTNKRKETAFALLSDYKQSEVFEVLNKAFKSDFLRGKNPTGFVATYDWLVNRDNFIKILEGNYDNRTPVNNSEPNGNQLRSNRA